MSVCCIAANDSNHQWLKPKFTSECYFLTIQCQHLAVMPIIRRHSRRVRAIRDLTRMCDELERTEAQWRLQPNAQRNVQLLSRWKSQLQVGVLCLKYYLFANQFHV